MWRVRHILTIIVIQLLCGVICRVPSINPDNHLIKPGEAVDQNPVNETIGEANATLYRPQDFWWYIKGTETRLHLDLGPHIFGASEAMAIVIYRGKKQVCNQMVNSGDGPVANDHFSQLAAGFRLQMASIEDEHLTWGIAGSALDGLWEALYEEGKIRLVTFDVYDGKWGRVATGLLDMTHPEALDS